MRYCFPEKNVFVVIACSLFIFIMTLIPLLDVKKYSCAKNASALVCKKYI